MKVTYKALNNITGLIDTIHIDDVQEIIEDEEGYSLYNDKGMLIFNDVAIIGGAPRLRLFKCHIEKIKIGK